MLKFFYYFIITNDKLQIKGRIEAERRATCRIEEEIQVNEQWFPSLHRWSLKLDKKVKKVDR